MRLAPPLPDGLVVVDHRDIPGKNAVSMIEDDQPCLAAEEIRHAEEPVLLLAHDGSGGAAGRSSADRARSSRASRCSIRCASPRVFKEITIRKGDVAAALAPGRRGGRGRVPHRPPGARLHRAQRGHRRARGDGRRHRLRLAAVSLLRAPRADGAAGRCRPSKVRVVQTETGGGFGGKEEYPSMIAGHAALLALQGAAARSSWSTTAQEDMVATTKRHPAIVRHRTGLAPRRPPGGAWRSTCSWTAAPTPP